jgi:hypothetical protein
MTSIALPDPVVRRPGPRPVDAHALARELRRRVDGEVRFGAGSRGPNSTDASNYRQVPIGVVVPHTIDAGMAAVAVCRRSHPAGPAAWDRQAHPVSPCWLPGLAASGVPQRPRIP